MLRNERLNTAGMRCLTLGSGPDSAMSLPLLSWKLLHRDVQSQPRTVATSVIREQQAPTAGTDKFFVLIFSQHVAQYLAETWLSSYSISKNTGAYRAIHQLTTAEFFGFRVCCDLEKATKFVCEPGKCTIRTNVENGLENLWIPAVSGD